MHLEMEGRVGSDGFGTADEEGTEAAGVRPDQTVRADRESSPLERPRTREESGEVAGRLILHGRAAEDAGDPIGALDLYARALTMLGAEPRRTDIARVVHRVGRCSSRLGDAQSAWDAHVVAARLIQGDHGPGELGGILAEAGLLLVGHQPSATVRDVISHALLLDGLADAIDHASDSLLGIVIASEETAMVVHRELTGLMLLASTAAADVILEQGALALYHRVALPLAVRAGELGWEVANGAVGVAVTFDALARLYEAIGKQEGPQRVAEPPTFEEVRALVELVTLAFAGAPHAPMSRWLGSYLRERRGATWVTEEVLNDIRNAA